jgi:hypothetical protein
MQMYRPEGLSAFRLYAAAVAEEHQAAHELAECAKIEVYHLIAAGLFTKVNEAHSKSIAAFKTIETFKKTSAA